MCSHVIKPNIVSQLESKLEIMNDKVVPIFFKGPMTSYSWKVPSFHVQVEVAAQSIGHAVRTVFAQS